MKVRAKFLCTSIRHLYTGANSDRPAIVELSAVWGDGKGNESWSKATPQGKVEMTITNPGAIDAFELGKSYFMDFTPAE